MNGHCLPVAGYRFVCLAGLFAGLLAACRPAPEVAPADAQRAAQIVQTFKTTLVGELSAALPQGPEHAITVCRRRAPALADSLSRDGVAVGRASHRVRNPANAPEPWMEPLLAAYLDDSSFRDPQAVRLGEDRVGYVEPLVTQAMCLPCHGSSIAPSVEARLRELYPDDQATGFQEGDLRGIVWATLPAGH